MEPPALNPGPSVAAFEPGDRALLAVVDAAGAEAARRAGDRLVCRAGCTECCIGPFAITALDAARLQAGLSELEASDRSARGDPRGSKARISRPTGCASRASGPTRSRPAGSRSTATPSRRR